jgi:hypothetical protein
MLVSEPHNKQSMDCKDHPLLITANVLVKIVDKMLNLL